MANQEEEVLGKAYDARLMRRLHKYLAHAPGSHSILDSWLSSQPMKGIAQIALLYVGTLVLTFFCEFLQTYYMQWTGQMVMFDLRSQIFRHLQRMHIGFYDKNPVGRLVTRVTTDVDALNDMFTAGVVSIFEDVFVLAGILAIMLCMDWKLALITFAVLPLIFWATMVFRVKVRDSYRRIRVAIARINSYLQEAVSGMLVLQLFNREKRALRQFSKINASHMEAFKDAIMAYAVYYPVVEILSAIAVAAIIWFGGGHVIQNIHTHTVTIQRTAHFVTLRVVPTVTTIGILVAFMQYAQRFFRPIQDLSDKYNILQSAMASSERIFKLLDTPVDIESPAITKKPEGPGRIEFDQVWFSYGVRGTASDSLAKLDARAPTDSSSDGAALDWVLRDVSFTIEPGETIAVVGHTGAGKTTLISLLLRFYDVQKGAIRIDGVDVKEMDLNDLRRRFGVVLQDPFLFSGTVAGNIRLGSDWIADKDVERAAEEVNLADFIRTLPGGFGEEVRERGSTLSTGQKQLISFARALAHNPQILILDEATSSVDTETEFRVREALSRMVQGRTSLVIAHRLSTVQRADKIIVMHKGRVREMGTHQQLLAQRGIYYKLYQLQYKDQEIPVASPTQSQPTVSADD
ncbi:MAG: antibiotic ABC transporter ATP-binding protein [Acidobacteria bacterium]|nr:MAG: antibiotic ABC transporter ATP-binding protein [Acidobacteriota bacterium]